MNNRTSVLENFVFVLGFVIAIILAFFAFSFELDELEKSSKTINTEIDVSYDSPIRYTNINGKNYYICKEKTLNNKGRILMIEADKAEFIPVDINLPERNYVSEYEGEYKIYAPKELLFYK